MIARRWGRRLSLQIGHSGGADPWSARVPWTRSASAARLCRRFRLPVRRHPCRRKLSAKRPLPSRDREKLGNNQIREIRARRNVTRSARTRPESLSDDPVSPYELGWPFCEGTARPASCCNQGRT
jgi:hypothetical protein